MRICLLTGGGYPYRRDALGGWCRALVEGLPGGAFELVTITDRGPAGAPVYPLPGNAAGVRAIGLPEDGRRPTEPTETDLAAAQLLCRGLLGADPMVADGLRRLAGPRYQPLDRVPPAAARRQPLDGVPLADVLIDAWRASRAAPGVPRRPVLPRLSVRDARTAAALLRHAVRALAVQLPAADVVHCVGGTAPLLAALGTRWRTGVPLLLTEARSAVERRRPAEDRLSPAVRLVLDTFRSSAQRTGYAHASLIAPISGYHHGWAQAHGADPARLVVVPAGADPQQFPPVAEPEHAPALVWTGAGGPDSGLLPLLEAFAHVAAASPTTVLHLTGITAAHADHAAEQVGRCGLGHRIRLHQPSAGPRDRYAAGHVVVHVPGAGDPPARLIEAMLVGRAVAGVEGGPVAEILGHAGVLVPGHDPAALGAACLALLRSPAHRRALGDAARRRALACFTTGRMVRAYGALYADLAGPSPTAFELAGSAPRAAMPGSVRRLTRERG